MDQSRSGDPCDAVRLMGRNGQERLVETRINEIADGIFRLSTHVGEVAPPDGFSFNQFLVTADDPLLYHCVLIFTES